MSVYLNKHTTEVYKYAVKRAENRAKVSKLSFAPVQRRLDRETLPSPITDLTCCKTAR